LHKRQQLQKPVPQLQAPVQAVRAR
jgi:hypothetical protein